MPEPLSGQLFEVREGHFVASSMERRLARDLGLRESWFRDAVFANPELAIGPCRAAGITDDDWYPWEREYHVAVGAVDVLLVSSAGRVAIVETKLAYNPELRRTVLAQALDYLAHLPDALQASTPPLPVDDTGAPVADIDDVRDSVVSGDVLVIVLSDQADERVCRLSQRLLGEHLVSQWDLAVVDLALYSRSPGSGEFFVVPCLRAQVIADKRQVVQVLVEGDTPRARVQVVTLDDDSDGHRTRYAWDEGRFFGRLQSVGTPSAVLDLAKSLQALAVKYPMSLSISWGSGKTGSMVLKRRDLGLVELHGGGDVRFRTGRFAGALGDNGAKLYRERLRALVPHIDSGHYVHVPPHEVPGIASALAGVLSDVIALVETEESNVG